jgi:hypothetical protein
VFEVLVDGSSGWTIVTCRLNEKVAERFVRLAALGE